MADNQMARTVKPATPTPRSVREADAHGAPGPVEVGAGEIVVRLPETTGRPAKRSFTIRGHRTSISLEVPFWSAFAQIARDRDLPLSQLVAAIDEARGSAGLSSAIRVFVLEHYRNSGEHLLG